MKAVIVEIKDGFAAILSDDGCLTKIKDNNYEPGQIIQVNKTRINLTRKITALAATAAAVVILGVGTWAYADPYSYVSLDVNPSIEYTVNRFERVLSVKAVNDDGEEILKEINLNSLKNQSIKKALTETIDQISKQGYFDGSSEGGIMITTSGKNFDKAVTLADELQQSAEKEVEENDDTVVIEACSVGLDRVKEANELGVTPGKLNLVERLKQSSPDPDSIDINEWLNKSVKDIMKATKENKKLSSLSETDDTQEDTTEQQLNGDQPGNKGQGNTNQSAANKENDLKAGKEEDNTAKDIISQKGQSTQQNANNKKNDQSSVTSQSDAAATSRNKKTFDSSASAVKETDHKSGTAGKKNQAESENSNNEAKALTGINEISNNKDGTNNSTNDNTNNYDQQTDKINDNRDDTMDTDSKKADKAADNAADTALSDSSKAVTDNIGQSGGKSEEQSGNGANDQNNSENGNQDKSDNGNQSKSDNGNQGKSDNGNQE